MALFIGHIATPPFRLQSPRVLQGVRLSAGDGFDLPTNIAFRHSRFSPTGMPFFLARSLASYRGRMTGANDNSISEHIAQMRDELEAIGCRFTPSFNECIEIVRRNLAAEGDFMSFEETAFHVLEGGMMEMGLKRQTDFSCPVPRPAATQDW